MTPQFRPAERDDAAAMAALEARSSVNPWTEQQYAESIDHHVCWLLELEGEAVGLLVYNPVFDEVELLNVVIDSRLRGQGLGKKCIQQLIDENRGTAKKIFLEVRESNQVALGLYQSFNFSVSGIRKNYYPSGSGRENALLMGYDYDYDEYA